MQWVPKKIAQKGFGQERNEWSKMRCTNWISIECKVLLQHLNDQDLQEQRSIFLNFLLPEPNYSQARILRYQQAPTLLSVSPVSPLIGNPTIHRHPTHNKHEFDSPALNITNIPHMYHLEKAEQRHHKPNHTPQMTITFVPNKLNSIQPTLFEIQVVNKAEFLIWMSSRDPPNNTDFQTQFSPWSSHNSEYFFSQNHRTNIPPNKSQTHHKLNCLEPLSKSFERFIISLN